MLINILLVIVAYLLGSIPSAIWIGRRFYGVDVREFGSKNAGATNTLRVLGAKAALPVFLIDFFKGYIAILIGNFSPLNTIEGEGTFFYFRLVMAIAVVCGHMLPIFANFKGGKGVATTAGLLLALSPFPMLLSFLSFLIVLIATKYVSLGSIIAAFLFPIYTAFLFHKSTHEVVFSIIIAILLIITHRKNIKRLINGTESKTTFKKSK